MPAELRDSYARGLGVTLTESDTLFDGGSGVIGPDGAWIAGPVHDEQIIYAELELERCDEQHHDLDVAGHYTRPELFRVEIDGRRHPVLSRREE